MGCRGRLRSEVLRRLEEVRELEELEDDLRGAGWYDSRLDEARLRLGLRTVTQVLDLSGRGVTGLDPFSGQPGDRRDLEIGEGEVVNGAGDFSAAPVERQLAYHPRGTPG